MKTKTFDCVEMKRRGAMRVHERLKDMTVEQQVEYWHRRNEEFLRGKKRSPDQSDASPRSSGPPGE
jgi:hypothetical protein